MDHNILVTISCITYNHEKYIADAIESFLMQKVSFNYEILIHDDASTDKTQDIIREYAMKYPDIIKPILQHENQYSKGKRVGMFHKDIAKGKYVAICEGDDYWTDTNKLQKQIDYMENHPESSMCVHASYRVKPNKKKKIKHIRPNIGHRDYNVQDIILGGGGLFATNSIVYLKKFNEYLPDFYIHSLVGDFPLTIMLALQGNVHYIDEYLSAYRVNVPGSWNEKTASNINNIINNSARTSQMLDELNQYTKYLYNEVINEKKLINSFNLLILEGKYDEIKESNYKQIYSQLPVFKKTKLIMKQHFGKEVSVIKKILFGITK